MSTHIGVERRLRALLPPDLSEDAHRPRTIVQAVAAFTTTTALAGVALCAAAFALQEWYTALAGSTLLILSAIGGAVLVCDRMTADRIADRQEFYRRGQLDGWMRGWRGQEPESDDPLLKD